MSAARSLRACAVAKPSIFGKEEPNPNVVYDLKNTLDEFRVYQQLEIEKFANIFYSGDTQKAGDLGRLKSALNPALQRYGAL